MMKNVKSLVRMLAPIALLCGGAASAADTGFYVGVSLGEANYDVPEVGSSGAFGIVSSSYGKDSGSAAALSVGYRITKSLGVEFSYMDIGSYTYSETGRNTAPLNSGELDYEASAAGFGIALTIAAPIGKWDFHGKIGGLQTKTEATLVVRSNTVVQRTTSENASTLETMFTLGVGYNVTEHFNFALDWTGIKDVGDEKTGGEADVNVVFLGGQYRF